ncbi:dihydrofolate reductase family protein [Arthrobacter sp. zg-Y826]|uniref:dihydrofolate reductase family protein n=1 Tax=Arthrobacter jinronghuae TaxID=2964609 RepID=UPI00210545A4|nr:dihydrofolate reductase family protein [Arthrobacter jinronghuae]MCQ1955536.1 dihydrofolate reductase family protein [Arthrobacter jinronghuae]
MVPVTVTQCRNQREGTMAGRVSIDLFMTLDGVAQAPGGPEEDPEAGFAYGGWQAPLFDETVGAQVDEGISSMDALLLGRKTYDIFADYWPHQLDGGNSDIARKFDSIPKYVVSRGTPELGRWRDSHHLEGDLADAVAGLRARHQDVHVIGSIDFARTLVAGGMFDSLNLWVYPVVLGPGKRLFPPDGPPAELKLLEASAASENGAVLLRYGWAGPAPATGVMGS